MKKILIVLCVLASSTAAYAELQKDSSLSDRYNAAKLNEDKFVQKQRAMSILAEKTDKESVGNIQIEYAGSTVLAYLETTSGEICKITMMPRDLSSVDCVRVQ